MRRAWTAGLVVIILLSGMALNMPRAKNYSNQQEYVRAISKKDCYQIGEEVRINLTNIADVPIYFSAGWFWTKIFNESGSMIHDSNFTMGYVVKKDPGKSIMFGWIQMISPGVQVPPGNYTVWMASEYGWVGDMANPIYEGLIGDTTGFQIGTCSLGLVAEAGLDQTVNEGDVVEFNGTGSVGSEVPDYWDSFEFGADSWITSAPSEAILATFNYSGTAYPALVAMNYGNGRAVYAPGSTFTGIGNIVNPGNVRHQLFINSVIWSTKDKDPKNCNILVVWGHRELLTYHSSVPGEEGMNITRALEDEGYNVSTSHDVPGSLANYDAVIIPGIGWSWYGWVNPNLWSGPGGTDTAHKPTTAEVTTLLSFVQNGGGLVASVEYEYGADWLQDVGNPMGVHFAAITWETPFTAYRIVEHPIFLRWSGEPAEIISFEWDFESDGAYDYVETVDSAPDGAFDGKTTHIYGDNGEYTATLRITDETNATDTDICNITVNNVAPTITEIFASTYTYANITLRLAGEKWHDATMYLYEDGIEIDSATVVRTPGSPNEQARTIENVYLNLTKTYTAKVVYTPDNDPINGQPNGANPAWIILTFEDGNETRIHHTFNVMHPETWEWNVDLNQYLMHEITIETLASDLGSDDLTFNWSFGVSTTYYNNGMAPDPYPSPDGTFPFEAKDVVEYNYSGSVVIILIVTDDDGGTATGTIALP